VAGPAVGRIADPWLIRNSRERDVRPPTSPHEALQDLEWLIGTWQDQSEDAQVITTVRWSPNRAFLIRSFTAQATSGLSTGEAANDEGAKP